MFVSTMREEKEEKKRKHRMGKTKEEEDETNPCLRFSDRKRPEDEKED